MSGWGEEIMCMWGAKLKKKNGKEMRCEWLRWRNHHTLSRIFFYVCEKWWACEVLNWSWRFSFNQIFKANKKRCLISTFHTYSEMHNYFFFLRILPCPERWSFVFQGISDFVRPPPSPPTPSLVIRPLTSYSAIFGEATKGKAPEFTESYKD